ncbi:cadherin EGF LAG seven-pass G-type receptor 1-like [Anneissia japonica]|uniref:cadherin EGF LAG seven-pass G-type receptor 1-like n=1 Tax=Anneissia japonica TaxID=1529436 RepID=UPI0014256CE8|nr:cadherin EGF LAG seven-pass G-type receptor 1-like [Anneissia japonica]
MMELWILRIVFLLVFQKRLYQCEILWNELETECQPHLQKEKSVNISHTVEENCSIGSIIYDLSTEFGSGNLFFERNLNRRFAVKNDTGVIVVDDVLDFESNPTEVINFIVFNNADGKITNVHLVVDVLDVDEPPSWAMAFHPYKAQFTLDNDADDVVYRLSAFDPENRTNTLVYGMFSDEYNLFNVNPKNGEISLKTRPSLSTLPEDVLRITVTVTEKDNLQNRNAADVFFYTSSQPPQFTLEGYTININENIEVPTKLATVKARSFQSDGSISYSIIRQPDNIQHSIDEFGIVKVLSTLDREYRTGYTILVKATDSLDQITVAEVIQFIFEVDRNATTGYHIGQVFAYHPNGNALQFTMKSGTASPYFKMQQETGILSLVSSAEALEPSCSVVVIAMDSNLVRGGMDSTFEEVSVNIRTKDLNQHTPQFPDCRSYSTVEVTEEQMTGTFVLNVTAVDRDKGRNGEVEFSLSLNTDGSTVFKIETSSGGVGIIRTRQSLDHEIKSRYTISVIATDLAMDYQLRNTCTIDIRVLDINDNHPLFDYPRYTRKL